MFYQVRDLMGTDQVKVLINHIVIGNQIVVKGSHNVTIDSLLSLLSTLLPFKCAKNFGYRSKYEPENLCNFIGVPTSVEIPLSSRILVLDLVSSTEDGRFIRSFDLTIRSCRSPTSYVPAIVDEMVDLINGSRNLQAETTRKCLKSVLKKWTTRAMNYYLAMKVKHKTDSYEEAAFLECFHCRQRDVPVLRFFVSAYDKAEKVQLLKEVQ